MVQVKGHYRNINGKKVWVESHERDINEKASNIIDKNKEMKLNFSAYLLARQQRDKILNKDVSKLSNDEIIDLDKKDTAWNKVESKNYTLLRDFLEKKGFSKTEAHDYLTSQNLDYSYNERMNENKKEYVVNENLTITKFNETNETKTLNRFGEDIEYKKFIGEINKEKVTGYINQKTGDVYDLKYSKDSPLNNNSKFKTMPISKIPVGSNVEIRADINSVNPEFYKKGDLIYTEKQKKYYEIK